MVRLFSNASDRMFFRTGESNFVSQLCSILSKQSSFSPRIFTPITGGKQQTVVIDFSSPNIAKPFHLGHFRATVTGNFLCNINRAAGHKVIGINYLGDFGTQFDLLAKGWEKYGNEEELSKDPIRYLHKLYVRMNTESMQNDPANLEYRNDVSPTKLTQSGKANRLLWDRFRNITMQHLSLTYSRMNVHFSAYEYESDYVQPALNIVASLVASGLAVADRDGATCIPANTFTDVPQRIVLLKSDNSTLYLTRDIAAAISRYERYHFDKMHYVVEDGQRLHFRQLQHILTRMGHSWADRTQDTPNDNANMNLHIPFGRVQGVSTRRGEGLFLSEILDNARSAVLRRMAHSPNTRISSTADDVADQMGITCLVISMLRKSRQKPIFLKSFLGYPVVSNEGTRIQDVDDGSDLSGLGLQYCHARLCSLEDRATNVGLISPSNSESVLNADGSSYLSGRLSELPSPFEAATLRSAPFIDLMKHLSEFPDVLRSAYSKYEASVVVSYCNKLVSLVNTAWTKLPVLQCDVEGDRLLRLALFIASRNVLATCLELLGVRPLRVI